MLIIETTLFYYSGDMYEWTSLAMGNELGMKCITNKGNLDNPGAYVGIVMNKKRGFQKNWMLVQ